eukprot:2827344-Amphidinium_carterae.1
MASGPLLASRVGVSQILKNSKVPPPPSTPSGSIPSKLLPESFNNHLRPPVNQPIHRPLSIKAIGIQETTARADILA